MNNYFVLGAQLRYFHIMKGRKKKGKPGRAQRQGKVDKHAPKGVESTVKAYITKHPGVKIKQLVAHCIKRFHHEKVMHAGKPWRRKMRLTTTARSISNNPKGKLPQVSLSKELLKSLPQVMAMLL